MKQTPNWKNVVSVGIATNENFTDSAGVKQQSVEFHNLVAWGKTAELLNNYVRKGSKIYVEWKIQTRNWEKDWIKHYKTEINVFNMEFLSKKPEWQTAWQVQSDDSFNAEVKADNWVQKQRDIQTDISVDDIRF